MFGANYQMLGRKSPSDSSLRPEGLFLQPWDVPEERWSEAKDLNAAPLNLAKSLNLCHLQFPYL